MYFLYLKLLLPYVIATGSRDRSLRVIDGRDARPEEYPYVVRLEVKDATASYRHRCTASVLTPTVSLTAAHCCSPLDNSKTNVIRYGSAPGKPTEDDRFSDVLSCTQHQPLNIMRKVDIALLVTQPIHLRGYARLSAIDHSALYGQRVQVLGYGITEHSSGLNDTLSLKLPLQVMDAMLSKCEEVKKYPMVCVKRACGSRGSLCRGDSGGPVVHASGIVGVNSMSSQTGCQKGDDRSYNVDLIVPLSTYGDWITDRLADTTFF